MGKTITISDRPRHAERVSVRRSEVRSIVQEAIGRAETAHPSDALLLGKEGLLAAVDNNDTIDASAWKCVDSCGCPLTAAGRVVLSSESSDQIWDMPLIFRTFFRSYDSLARSLAARKIGRSVGNFNTGITFVFED